MTALRFTEKWFVIAACLSAFCTLFIFGFMVWLGLPIFREGLFVDILTQPWLPDKGVYGIFPMLLGTVFISLFSVLTAFPLSLGCAGFICGLGPEWAGKFLRKTVRMMTGIPTVIYGFVGIFLLVPFIRELFDGGSGMCMFSAGLLLAVLISPTMILFFTESFDRVPRPYLDAVEALGGSNVQKLLYVVLPWSSKGILAGTVLSLGRAVGDTLIALMIAGNAVSTPGSILDSARTLTAHIALIIAADFDSIEFRTIFVCGIVLYGFTALLVLLVRAIGSRSPLTRQQ